MKIMTFAIVIIAMSAQTLQAKVSDGHVLNTPSMTGKKHHRTSKKFKMPKLAQADFKALNDFDGNWMYSQGGEEG